ncbi:MAG: hypothetical protein U0164_08460 [Gemmatimonadaceae bacterium]
MPRPSAATTSPFAVARDTSTKRESAPAYAVIRSTGVASAAGATIGAKGGSDRRKTTSPSSTTPMGPNPGLSNASSRCVCALVTSSAEKTRPLSMTSAPWPRASSEAATRTESERFAGPSQDSSLALRIAPVKTIGFSVAIDRVAR